MPRHVVVKKSIATERVCDLFHACALILALLLSDALSARTTNRQNNGQILFPIPFPWLQFRFPDEALGICNKAGAENASQAMKSRFVQKVSVSTTSFSRPLPHKVMTQLNKYRLGTFTPIGLRPRQIKQGIFSECRAAQTRKHQRISQRIRSYKSFVFLVLVN